MSLSLLTSQELEKLYTERQDVVLEICDEMQTTRPTPNRALVLISMCNAASAALGEVKAELLKRQKMQVSAPSEPAGW
jgi:hypothetical protein